MSIRIDLPPDLASKLSTEAAQLNLPLSDYILQVLSARSVLGHSPKTGAELVAYWQNAGIIGSQPEITNL